MSSAICLDFNTRFGSIADKMVVGAMSVNPRVGAWLLWLMNSWAGRGADSHRPVLYAVYGSDITVRLMRIHAHLGRDGPNGWLVVALRGRRAAYVHCRFAD